jgi:hypothetical protein
LADCLLLSCTIVEESDNWPRCPLRAREPPRSRAAEQSDEFAPFQARRLASDPGVFAWKGTGWGSPWPRAGRFQTLAKDRELIVVFDCRIWSWSSRVRLHGREAASGWECRGLLCFRAAGTIRTRSTFFIIGEARGLMPHFLNVLHKMPRSDQLILLAAVAGSLFVIIAAVVLVLLNPSVQPYGGELGPPPK